MFTGLKRGRLRLQRFRQCNVDDFLVSLQKLDKRSDIVVSLLLYGKTERETGEVVHVSHSRVAQLFSRAVASIGDSMLLLEWERRIAEAGDDGWKIALGVPVGILPLSIRTRNVLASMAIRERKNLTVRDLVVRWEIDLLREQCFGRKSLAELVAVLEKYGLCLGIDPAQLPTVEA